MILSDFNSFSFIYYRLLNNYVQIIIYILYFISIRSEVRSSQLFIKVIRLEQNIGSDTIRKILKMITTPRSFIKRENPRSIESKSVQPYQLRYN